MTKPIHKSINKSKSKTSSQTQDSSIDIIEISAWVRTSTNNYVNDRIANPKPTVGIVQTAMGKLKTVCRMNKQAIHLGYYGDIEAAKLARAFADGCVHAIQQYKLDHPVIPQTTEPPVEPTKPSPTLPMDNLKIPVGLPVDLSADLPAYHPDAPMAIDPDGYDDECEYTVH
jgi:hypothetical protein